MVRRTWGRLEGGRVRTSTEVKRAVERKGDLRSLQEILHKEPALVSKNF